MQVPSERYEVDPLLARALEVILIIHMDHEQNASTSTVRTAGDDRPARNLQGQAAPDTPSSEQPVSNFLEAVYLAWQFPVSDFINGSELC